MNTTTNNRPTYAQNVELYRHQLWLNVLRQCSQYPHSSRPSRERFNAKLMKYAKGAGKNYMDLFNSSNEKDQDIPVGWAGKKRKQMIREQGHFNLGRKAPRVKRTVVKGNIAQLSLGNRLSMFKYIPVEPLEPWTVEDLHQIIDCRNGKRGCLHFIDSGMNTIRTIEYIRDQTLDESEVIALWSSISIPRTRPGSEGEVRPLFRRPHFRRQQ